MEPERWERIKRIFSAALEQDTGDRAEILRDLCGGDESLRAEVESMLARHAKEPGWLKTLGLGPGAFFSESAPTRSSPLPSADDVHEGNSDVLTNGTILGQYCITGKLGEGGMGTVYRGYDQVLRRDVAIKILRSGQREDSLGRERLLREARSAASLNHPNICTIYQVGEAEGKVYIAMELVTGQSLSQRLEDGGPLTPDETLRYSLQLADALAHAHEHGIIHRDLKCANVIVTPEQRCKVLDFGLAKRLESDGTGEETTLTALTEAGTVPGTPAYMAPEQLQGQPADARSDVWAFGVMLYEAVVGKRPFRGNTSFELISAIVNGKPAPLPSKIPIALQNVVECCLSKDPDKRHSNGRELHAALEKIQSGETNGLLALFHNRHRRRLMTGILTTVAVVALAALLVLFNPFRLRDRVASLISTARIDTVAVLPFVNLTGDRAQDSLANGMTDALITDLAQFRGLKRVIGYLSVARYKDSNLPPKEIARQLQVASLITGTVNQLEDRVTVNIQLIDPATGVQLWGQTYERGIKDRLALQNDVLRAVTEQLRVQLTPEEKVRLSRSRSIVPEAEEAFRKGMDFWYKHTVEDIGKADQYFNLALEKDPEYIDAYIGKATVLVYYGSASMDTAEVISALREIQKKVLELDPEHPLAKQDFPDLKFYYEWDWAGAELGYKKQIEYRYNSVYSYSFYWEFLASMKRMKEAEAIVERAFELDPYNPLSWDSKGKYLLYARRFDDGIGWYKDFIKGKYDFGVGSLRLWTAYHHQHMEREAFENAKASFAGIPEIEKVLDQGHEEAGYAGAMRRLAGFLAETPDSHKLCTNIARLYAYGGDKDAALSWLEKAYGQRDSGLVEIQIDPDWDSLRQEPRFRDIVARMKFPQ